MNRGYTLALTVLFSMGIISCQQQKKSKQDSSTEEQSHSHDHSSGSHSHDDSLIKETFSIEKLIDEVKTVPDSIIEYLHAQHHNYKVLERRTVPSGYETKNLKYWKDYAAKVEDLPTINPGPGEYVHGMEGYKHGYQNLVIGITETFPGGAPPMHTHKGEESHVLLEGEILFHSNGEDYPIKKMEHLSFLKDEKHWVEAFEDSKFLIIR